MIPAGSPFANIRIRTAASTASGISIHVVDLLIPIGTNKAVTPRIAMMLNMLLPRTLPNASAELPSIDEMIFTTSSGVEVPKATTVRPITIFGTFSRWASAAPPSTSKLAPYTKIINPANK